MAFLFLNTGIYGTTLVIIIGLFFFKAFEAHKLNRESKQVRERMKEGP